MSDLHPGAMIGRYKIVETRGQGGMATVYRAMDTRLEREVAVKVIRTEMFPPAILKEVLARFEREAKALARLDHPNILRVFDFGEHENVPYLVMAFVGGGSLRERLQGSGNSGHKMPIRESAAMLAPIARALHYAHGHHIVHRDVKPANILLNDRDEPLLSDFGIAKILDAGGGGLTGTGLAIGTPEYMAPEQSAGDDVDARVDIYALGVVFFEMISGRRPFEGSTPIDVLIKIRTAPLPSIRTFLPEATPEVELILNRALARETGERYASMALFATDLDSLALGPTQPAFTPVPAPGPTAVQTMKQPTPPPFTPPPAHDSGQTIQTPPSWPASRPQAAPLTDSGQTLQTPQPVYHPPTSPRPQTPPASPIPMPPAPAQAEALKAPSTAAQKNWVVFAIAFGILLVLLTLLFPGSGLVPPAPTPTFQSTHMPADWLLAVFINVLTIV